MRLLLQRVLTARVTSGGRELASAGRGMLVFAGFGVGDEDLAGGPVWRSMVDKLLDLRIFPDEAGRMNVGLLESGGDLLLVSQFTLYATCRKGRRPSFDAALPPDRARELYGRLCSELYGRLAGRFSNGEFGADMEVTLTNWGPVTVMLDSADFAVPRGSRPV